MNWDGSVTNWFRQVQEGDPDGVQPLWERYCVQLQALARKKLGRRRFGVADSEDIALSAFHSLCQGLERGQFPALDSRDNLWRLLIVITARKTSHLVRDQQSQKRGGTAQFLRPGADLGNVEQTITDELTPDFLAQAVEEYQRLIDLLGREDLRNVARWKMEGYTNREIAEKLDCVVRSVDRKLLLIRHLWEEEIDQ